MQIHSLTDTLNLENTHTQQAAEQDSDEIHEHLDAVKEEVANRHEELHKRVDWIQILNYVAVGATLVALILAVVTLVIMMYDRKKIDESFKILLKTAEENNMGRMSDSFV